ncbi:MAG: hypothetical protein A3E88_07575 [Legionellales bacterium RIFCSPHIGHO2_12_FULL_35_11]|nr:MAG: hypothetical protein A3E88_07575 [Legionellales bacterium RIFCSPHIGHO2_12_FULL_35_11]
MSNKNTYFTDDEISKVFRDPTKITKVLQAGIQAALLKHKQAGNPICEWQDNQVVWITPEKINLKPTKKRG